METRQLKIFCVVARSGNLGAAASQFHLTPSAISHTLKGLETEIGCRLFNRVGKKLLLNQAGEQLLDQVEKPLAQLDAAAASLKDLSKWGQTRLRIGAAASACQYLLPAVIRELRKTFPKVTLQLESGDMPEMIEALQRNQIDLALGVAPNESAVLETRPVFKDELLLVCAPSHPWAAGKPISREELRLQPLILYQRLSLTSRMMEDYFRSQEVSPSTVMEIASIEAIKELVKLNLGVSVLALWTANREITRGSLRMRPLTGRPLGRQWVVGHLAGRRLSLVEETFCRLCRTVASGMPMDRKDLPK